MFKDSRVKESFFWLTVILSMSVPVVVLLVWMLFFANNNLLLLGGMILLACGALSFRRINEHLWMRIFRQNIKRMNLFHEEYTQENVLFLRTGDTVSRWKRKPFEVTFRDLDLSIQPVCRMFNAFIVFECSAEVENLLIEIEIAWEHPDPANEVEFQSFIQMYPSDFVIHQIAKERAFALVKAETEKIISSQNGMIGFVDGGDLETNMALLRMLLNESMKKQDSNWVGITYLDYTLV